VNLASIIEDHPDGAIALISRGQETTYGELRDQVARLRGGLIGLGVRPGDRVAVVANNNWYFVAGYLAALGVGGVVVLLNPQSPLPELVSELAEAGVRVVLAGPTARAKLEELDRAQVPALELLVGCGFSPEGGVDLDELLRSEPAPMVERADDDLAVLAFTSGTAGLPRAAMLTHHNLFVNIRQTLAAAPEEAQTAEDVAFGVLPLFHIFGLNVVLGITLYTGSRVLLIERFDPISALEAIERHGVTIVSGPPTMWAAFAGLVGVDPEVMASVRVAASGASKLPAEVAQAVRARYGVELYEGYGLTEASPVVTSPAGMDAPIGSVGVPVPGVELRIVDLQGEDVLVGDAGELLVRGPNVFAGYWGDPEATERVIDAAGWLHTGDIAVVDDDGFIYLVDRMKDLIIVSGFNVFPAEVEEVLLQHPAVEACAVIGVPHPYTGEAVKAFVVTRSGIPVEEDDVVAFCAERLARYKCPNKVWFVEDIPRGLGGKVLRRTFREDGEAAGGPAGDAPAADAG
jgi:long-chain acyl-CoA synthetase